MVSISIVAIEDTSISIGISLTGNGGKQTKGYNSLRKEMLNGMFHITLCRLTMDFIIRMLSS